MLRRLVALFALVTGLAALSAPAQAAWIPQEKPSEVSSAMGKSSFCIIKIECGAQIASTTNSRWKVRVQPTSQPVHALASAVVIRVDRALE